MGRRPLGGGSEGAPVSLCRGVRPCPRGYSALVARPSHDFTRNMQAGECAGGASRGDPGEGAGRSLPGKS
eukprot:15418425-Alexandrium_andersonii.AAC.1